MRALTRQPFGAKGPLSKVPPSSEKLDSLTEREREVLGLIGRGLSNADIGGQLFMTEGTVKGYVSAILAKLGVENRVQAARIAFRAGLGR